MCKVPYSERFLDAIAETNSHSKNSRTGTIAQHSDSNFQDVEQSDSFVSIHRRKHLSIEIRVKYLNC